MYHGDTVLTSDDHLSRTLTTPSLPDTAAHHRGVTLCLTPSSSTCSVVTCHHYHGQYPPHLKLSLLLYGGAAPGDQVLHHLGRAVPAGQEEGRAPVDLAADHVTPLRIIKLLNTPGQVT